MESNLSQSQSRPPSVNSVHSVNLGSTYSGYFPQMHNHNAQNVLQQQQQQPQANISLGSMHYQPNTTYPMSYSVQSQHQPQIHPQQQPQPYVSGNNQTVSMNYHYSISASAAAAAAAAAFSSYHHQQNHQNHNYQQQAQQQQMVQWPASNVQQQQVGQYYPQQQIQQVQPIQQQPSDYQQYVSQYYREYYRRLMYQQHQQQIQAQQRAPHKFSRIHAHGSFSSHDNRLMVIEPNCRVALYNLQEIFTEQLYSSLHLQSLLTHTTTVQQSTDDGCTRTLLPFNDSKIALNWIRIRMLEDSNVNYELKLILKVIIMLYHHNGSVSGFDLSELLYEIVSGGLNNDSTDLSTDKLSQTGSDQVSQSKEQLLGHMRKLLMRGQRRVAITFAQNNGLFDHAIALAYLTVFLTPNVVTQGFDNGTMISTIRKFINTTLNVTDPLFVFYSHLLQIAANHANLSNTTGNPIPNTANSKIESLESFIILLANDIQFDKVEITNNSLRNLIDLMIALLKNDYDYVLPDDLFTERFDCLLVNECLEFARFEGQRHNPRLLLRKLEFAFELFDFGFGRQALNYCSQIRAKLTEASLDLKYVQENTTQMRASRLAQFLLPLSNLPETDDDENREYICNLWLFQMLKIITRYESSKTAKFDSPLIKVVESESAAAEDGEDENSCDIDETEHDDETTGNDIEDEDLSEEIEIDKNVSDKTNEPKHSNTRNEKNKNESKIEQDKSLKLRTLPLNQTPTTKNISQQMMNDTDNSNNIKHSTPILNDSKNHEELKVQSESSTQELPLSPPPATPSQYNQQQYDGASFQSLPSQPKEMFNQHFNANSRALNSIQETPFERTESFSSNPSQPQSPIKSSMQPSQLQQTTSFDYFASNGSSSFNTNSLQNELPSPQGDVQDSMPRRDSVNNNNNSSINFFQPPPPPSFDSSPPVLDFMSSGQVTNIPTFDPISLDDNDQHNSSSMMATAAGFNPNNGSRDFYQQSNQNNNTQPKSDSNKVGDQKDSNLSKNSPSKNGGILSSFFGKFKTKNQAILPDDSNPSIVYDPVLKRWVDKSAGDQGADAGLPPPPPKIPMGMMADTTVTNGNNNSNPKSEPNSTISSPMNANFPSSPSFPSFDSSFNQPAPTAAAGSGPMPNSNPIPNGNLTPFPSMPQPPPSANQFRGIGSMRKNRYIDVLNNTQLNKN